MISQHLIDSLDRYVQHRIPPGGFLTSVLENNLVGAVGKADFENQRNLVAICDYVYNQLPSTCWGSKEKVREWLGGKDA